MEKRQERVEGKREGGRRRQVWQVLEQHCRSKLAGLPEKVWAEQSCWIQQEGKASFVRQHLRSDLKRVGRSHVGIWGESRSNSRYVEEGALEEPLVFSSEASGATAGEAVRMGWEWGLEVTVLRKLDCPRWLRSQVAQPETSGEYPGELGEVKSRAKRLLAQRRLEMLVPAARMIAEQKVKHRS